jgi:hypothetical protein
LRIARELEAKFFELHAAIDFARLLMESGRRADAIALLTPIVNWFSEGVDAPDIKDARPLLEDVA